MTVDNVPPGVLQGQPVKRGREAGIKHWDIY